MGREQEWLWCNPTQEGSRHSFGISHKDRQQECLWDSVNPELVSVRPGVIGYFMKIYGAQSSVDGRLRVHTW